MYGGPQQVLYLMRGLASEGVQNALVCPPGSEIAREAELANIRTCRIACHGDHDVSFMLRLRRFLRSEAPDLVHAHSRRGADLYSARAAGAIPALLSRRVDSIDSPMMARLRYARYRSIIAISDNVAASLRASGVSASRIARVRSAVDAAAMQSPVPRERLNMEFDLPESAAAIAMVAQFIPRKGHFSALRALSGLVRQRQDLRLIFFGQGPLEAAVRKRVAELDLGNFVRFAGFRHDLDTLLGAADMLLHPAVREGLGIVMLKASAAGLPVVAFNVAGARETVVDGETGVLVPPNNNETLQQAINALIDDPARRARFGAAGQRYVEREFSISAMVDRHVYLYEAILNE
jgi:glycosyltransferase involved in cell wall biosynthesis